MHNHTVYLGDIYGRTYRKDLFSLKTFWTALFTYSTAVFTFLLTILFENKWLSQSKVLAHFSVVVIWQSALPTAEDPVPVHTPTCTDILSVQEAFCHVIEILATLYHMK